MAGLNKLSNPDVLTAENGKKALEIIEGTLPDLILSDVIMPEMDGIELCAALHENPLYSQIPFIVMSTEKDADTGCGIPDSARAKIFDPFFTTKAVGKGTGQGLTIAYDVVTHKHGGTLSFSSAIDEETTLTVRLPINET